MRMGQVLLVPLTRRRFIGESIPDVAPCMYFEGDMSQKQAGLDAQKEGDQRGTFLSWKLIANFNLPTLGMGFMYLLVNMYLMKYATDVLFIAPAAMGLIFGLSRLIDAITDPLVGFLSDRTRSRMGRRRPWILFSAVPVCSFFLHDVEPAGVSE